MRVASFTDNRRMSIPLTVISGPAGAGRTSLVRHLMQATADRRVVAVVRELSPFLADAGGIRREGAILEWRSGCFTVASDDPTATLAVLARRQDRPEHVIIDVDGSVSPLRASGYAYMPGYRPDGMLIVVDAAAAGRAALDHVFDESMLAQFRSADVVVLNKFDAAGVQGTTAAQRSIGALVPSARFLSSCHGRVAPPLVLGPSSRRAPANDPTVVAEWRTDYLPGHSHDRQTPAGEHYRSWCLVGDSRIDSRAFRSWVARLPAAIIRGAGTVFLREDPQHRHEFSLIGSRWELTRGTPWGADIPATRITLVGAGSGARRPNDGVDAPPELDRRPDVDGDVRPSEGPPDDQASDDLSRMVM